MITINNIISTVETRQAWEQEADRILSKPLSEWRQTPLPPCTPYMLANQQGELVAYGISGHTEETIDSLQIFVHPGVFGWLPAELEIHQWLQ